MERRKECSSCSRFPASTSTATDQRCVEVKTETLGRCPSCNRFVPVLPVHSDNPCFECSLGEFVGCFGRRKRRQTKYLMRSHGEMVTAMNNVSHVNATLLERTHTAEDRATLLETKFAQMEQEMSNKEGLCKSSEAVAESARKEGAVLQKELSALRQERSKVDEECQMLRQTIRGLQNTSEEANCELNSVRAVLERTSSNLEESSKTHSILTSEKQTLLSKINILQNELEFALKKKHELADQVDNHTDYKNKTAAELDKLRAAAAELKEEKLKMEKDALCNTNYLQRELFRMAERYKRRQRTVERLTADKENLMDSLRHKTSMYEIDQRSWSRRDQSGVPETPTHARTINYDEHLNTKILELQLKLDRREGLVRALEDRLQFHEPDFTINTDDETAPYRDDEGGITQQASQSPVTKCRQEITNVEEFKTNRQISYSLLEDSGLDMEKIKLEDVTPTFTSTPKTFVVKKT